MTDQAIATEQAVTEPEAARDLSDPSLYKNRELSWLDFNDRVLQLAGDERLPLIERVKFLAIYVTNLDEFFMVRVAGLHDQIDARIDARGPDGLSPMATLQGIHEMVSEQDRRHCRQFSHDVQPALAEHGIRIVRYEEARRRSDEIERHFRTQIFPTLT